MIKRILAVNFGGLGDEILFLPALISLKKEFPNAEITLALEPRSASIVHLTNAVDNVIKVDIKGKNKLFEIVKFIQKAAFGSYQMIVASGTNPLISIIEFLTFIPEKYGYDTGIVSRILLSKTIKLNKKQYAAKMYHDLVTPVTSRITELPELTIEKEDKIPDSILIHPGVSLMSRNKGCIKTVTPCEWATLIDRLSAYGKHIILAGGTDDAECINEITANLKTKNYENYFGKTKSVADLAKLISSAEKFVCSDSAPMHIAAALGVKTYPIFGPTDDKKLLPKSENIIPLKAHDNCPLKPCLWARRQKTCKELHCLKFDLNRLARIICE